jgi:hypothetical protein
MSVPLNRIMTTQANRFDSNLESPKSQDSISRSRYDGAAAHRHARLSDFLVDAAAALVGLLLGSIAARRFALNGWVEKIFGSSSASLAASL